MQITLKTTEGDIIKELRVGCTVALRLDGMRYLVDAVVLEVADTAVLVKGEGIEGWAEFEAIVDVLT
jgi:hypothetical protein